MTHPGTREIFASFPDRRTDVLAGVTDEVLPRMLAWADGEQHLYGSNRSERRARKQFAREARARAEQYVQPHRAEIKRDIQRHPERYGAFASLVVGGPLTALLLSWVLSWVVRWLVAKIVERIVQWWIKRKIDDLVRETV